MAFVFYHEVVSDQFYWMLRFKELVVSHGGSVVASGDGNALYDPSGDVLTRSYGYLAASTKVDGGINNAASWFRLRLPGAYGVELLVTNGATNTVGSWTIYFSRLGFTGGSPSATVAPTATDQFRIFGTNSGGQALGGGATTGLSERAVRLDACFGDADEGHAFYCWMRHAHSTSGLGSGFWFDVLKDSDLTDSAPYLFAWVFDGVDSTDGRTRFGAVPTSFPNGGSDGYSRLWGYVSRGDDMVNPRPHGPLLPTQFFASSQAFAGQEFRYIPDPLMVRTNILPTALNKWPSGGSVIKGKSRLIRACGNGNQVASKGAVVDLGGGEYGLSLMDSGLVIARWDGTSLGA